MSVQTKNRRMLFCFIPLIASFLILTVGCRRSEPFSPYSTTGPKKHVLTIGLREDWKLTTEYSGTGGNNMTMWKLKSADGPFEFSFAGMHLPPGTWYTKTTTQYNDAWVTGTLQPLDTNWDYFACNMQIETKVPFELIFAGFQNTNTLTTNEDTVFEFKPGTNNISFTGHVVSVFEIPPSPFHKQATNSTR